MTVVDEVRGLVALRMADVVDRSAVNGDRAEFLSAADRLLEELDRLPIRLPSGGEPVGSDEPGDPRDRVVVELDRPPKVGNAAHT